MPPVASTNRLASASETVSGSSAETSAGLRESTPTVIVSALRLVAASSPAASALPISRAPRSDHDQAAMTDAATEVSEKAERRHICPVQIVQHDHQRRRCRSVDEHPCERVEHDELVARFVARGGGSPVADGSRHLGRAEWVGEGHDRSGRQRSIELDQRCSPDPERRGPIGVEGSALQHDDTADVTRAPELVQQARSCRSPAPPRR